MAERQMEVIQLNDSDEEEEENDDENSQDESGESEDSTDDDSGSGKDKDDRDVVTIEDSHSDSEESSDNNEGDEVVDLEQEDNFEEPVIVLEAIPLPEDVSFNESQAEPSTSKGSKVATFDDCSNIDDYDCFVDPEDESQTSTNVKDVVTDPKNVIEEFPEFEDFVNKSSDEIIRLSDNEIYIEDDQNVNNDSSIPFENEEKLCVPQEDCDNTLDFRIIGSKIFVEADTFHNLVPDVDATYLIEIIEHKCWKVSDCLKFFGLKIDFISLDVAHELVPKDTELGKQLSQLLPNNCYIDASKRTKDVPVSTTTTDSETTGKDLSESFIVTQTREMKRKGIRLPKGWKIIGTKTESETKSNGESYNYIRIDWIYKAPSGKCFKDLKKVLSYIKQNSSKFEKWEVKKPQQSNTSTENPPHHKTLKQQYEDELDSLLEKDVFALSGIRPVRKFPLNSQHLVAATKHKTVTAEDDDNNDLMPSRMSAMIKSNPISLAQHEKMMRKSGPAIQRFHLEKVSEVLDFNSEGWFSSKLMSMKYLINCKNSKTDKSELSLSSEYFANFIGKLKLKMINDEEVPRIREMQEYLEDYLDEADGMELNGSEDIGKIPSRPVSRSEQRQIPNFHRKLVKTCLKWPKSWVMRRESNTRLFISPDGESFSSIGSAVNCIRKQSSSFQYHTPKKSNTPNKRKFCNTNLSFKPSVMRKLPTFEFSPVKKLRIDVNKMIIDTNISDTDDSVEDLLSGTDDEDTNK